MISKKQKKAQEEIVGFVLIILLVVVISLVFFSFSMRKQKTVEKESLQVGSLLNSILDYTSECAVSYEPQYDSVRDLIKSCYFGDVCLNSKTSCETLDELLKDILNSSLGTRTSDLGLVKGYELNISHPPLQYEERTIAFLSSGNCKNTSSVASQLIKLNGVDATAKLRMCY